MASFGKAILNQICWKSLHIFVRDFPRWTDQSVCQVWSRACPFCLWRRSFLSVERDVLSTAKDFPHCLEHSAKRFPHSTTRITVKFKVSALRVTVPAQVGSFYSLLFSVTFPSVALTTAERRELGRSVSNGHSLDFARNLLHENVGPITSRILVTSTKLHALVIFLGQQTPLFVFRGRTHSTENVRPITSWILVPSTSHSRSNDFGRRPPLSVFISFARILLRGKRSSHNQLDPCPVDMPFTLQWLWSATTTFSFYFFCKNPVPRKTFVP